MVTIKNWFLKIHADGQPVIITWGYGLAPNERILPKNEDVIVTQKGLVIKHKNKEFFCDFSKILYEKTPIPLQYQETAGLVDIKEKHILHLIYDIISTKLYNNSPVVVFKAPFNLSNMVGKYLPDFGDKLRGIDFDAVVGMIPEEVKKS